MNITNFQHAAYAVLMMVPFVLAGFAWTGAAWSIAWFICREHTQRQTDIRIETGVAIAQQNPLKGFRGWSLDAKLDAAFPALACIVVAAIFG